MKTNTDTDNDTTPTAAYYDNLVSTTRRIGYCHHREGMPDRFVADDTTYTVVPFDRDSNGVGDKFRAYAVRDNHHTPGPWRVAIHASGLLKVESRDRVICDGFAKDYVNACLVAAAPDLLAALQEALEALDEAVRFTRGALDCSDVLDYARAIVAKATLDPNHMH
jgi:hypothetical protein